ncbi:MAG TPA: LPS export ABC transporter periplasmic protein LptC, partial [Bryobacteraceae bacterium]|nr:LPS export ABC transporter periplasmic protein LptC [Bryobacteraceae bacterium]
MRRGARWLLLAAIAAILASVVVTYRAKKREMGAEAPSRPAPLPTGTSSSAANYTHCQTVGNHTTYCIEASDMRERKDSGRADLKDVRLKLYNRDDSAFDLVTSDAATLTTSDNRFCSDGAVNITLGEPVAGAPVHALTSIQSSGICVDSVSGKADTDQPSTFQFQNGDGSATGASYDPSTGELVMKSNVEVHWRGKTPGAKPMKIEAGSLTYHEAESQIQLEPWGRLTRDNTVVEGQDAVVHLKESQTDDGKSRFVLHEVDAKMAHGMDSYPTRKLQYSAGEMTVGFDDDGVVQNITGHSNAQVTSTSDTTTTSVKANDVRMDFSTGDGDSVLQHVTATGNAVVDSKPLPAPGRAVGENERLSSQSVEMKMRDGGKDIESVVTHSPGTLEFLPNTPEQRHRIITGNDMTIAYGDRSRIQSFRTTNAATRTDPTAEERKRNRKTSTTTSRNLAAVFDPKTGKVSSIEQDGDFAYDEGDRHARAAKATLDSDHDAIALQTSARMWDSAGSTSAAVIHLDESTGDFTAEGGVISSHMPDQDPKKGSQMLNGSDPIQARAQKMASTNHNDTLHYEGGAVMSQGANRILADAIDVDRKKRTLKADGHVTTDLWEQPKDDAAPSGAGKGAAADKARAPVRTVAHAAHLVYTDEDRRAFYSGGVDLTRGPLHVTATRLEAFLSSANSGDSRLDKAFADGAVQIVDTAGGKTRTGDGTHSEYYATEKKVILRGSDAKLVDSGGNTSVGQ